MTHNWTPAEVGKLMDERNAEVRDLRKRAEKAEARVAELERIYLTPPDLAAIRKRWDNIFRDQWEDVRALIGEVVRARQEIPEAHAREAALRAALEANEKARHQHLLHTAGHCDRGEMRAAIQKALEAARVALSSDCKPLEVVRRIMLLVTFAMREGREIHADCCDALCMEIRESLTNMAGLYGEVRADA